MKKLILGLLSAAVAAAPIAAPAAAQDRRTTTTVRETPRGTVVTKRTTVRDDDIRDGRGNRSEAHSWRKGQRFDRRQAANYREIANYRSYRLSAPPRGHRWVRSGNDAVLVSISSGVIASVLANRIR